MRHLGSAESSRSLLDLDAERICRNYDGLGRGIAHSRLHGDTARKDACLEGDEH